MTDAATVLTALIRRGLTIGTAESLTGGRLADALVSVPGASAVFLGGVVSYATPIKSSVLSVDSGLLAERGAVDPDVAIAMARGVRGAMSVDGKPADVGVATTGVAGPEPADGKPVGTVYIAVSAPVGDNVEGLVLTGTRDEIRSQTVTKALELILQSLEPVGEIWTS